MLCLAFVLFTWQPVPEWLAQAIELGLLLAKLRSWRFAISVFLRLRQVVKWRITEFLWLRLVTQDTTKETGYAHEILDVVSNKKLSIATDSSFWPTHLNVNQEMPGDGKIDPRIQPINGRCSMMELVICTSHHLELHDILSCGHTGGISTYISQT